jgi:energy-coupling factor transporter ATP-binding protein EcfA2
MALLTLKDVHVTLGDRHLLQGVSMVVGEGERIGLLGPNGCGKSTLLRILAAICRRRRRSHGAPRPAGRLPAAGTGAAAGRDRARGGAAGHGGARRDVLAALDRPCTRRWPPTSTTRGCRSC